MDILHLIMTPLISLKNSEFCEFSNFFSPEHNLFSHFDPESRNLSNFTKLALVVYLLSPLVFLCTQSCHL